MFHRAAARGYETLRRSERGRVTLQGRNQALPTCKYTAVVAGAVRDIDAGCQPEVRCQLVAKAEPAAADVLGGDDGLAGSVRVTPAPPKATTLQRPTNCQRASSSTDAIWSPWRRMAGTPRSSRTGAERTACPQTTTHIDSACANPSAMAAQRMPADQQLLESARNRRWPRAPRATRDRTIRRRAPCRREHIVAASRTRRSRYRRRDLDAEPHRPARKTRVVAQRRDRHRHRRSAMPSCTMATWARSCQLPVPRRR